MKILQPLFCITGWRSSTNSLCWIVLHLLCLEVWRTTLKTQSWNKDQWQSTNTYKMLV